MNAVKANPLLLARSVRKTFPGTTALDGLDLTLRAGRITALAGHNGSGKSTLVKILAGVHKPDAGSITDGNGDPHAWRQRIHFIHQDLGLVDDLSAVENLDLVRPLGWRAIGPNAGGRERRHAHTQLAMFGMEIDVDAPVRTLTPAERTVVAIVRALDGWHDDAQVLVLDEATASLHEHEAARLLSAIKTVAGRGAAVLYVSHRLAELEQLADDVIVLRDGRPVAELDRGEVTAERLVDLIAGENHAAAAAARDRVTGAVRLRATGLRGGRVTDVSLDVGAGEVVGISGVIGSGAEDLLGLIFGAIPMAEGDIAVDQRPLKASHPAEAIAAGIGLVSRDRHRHAAVLTLNGRENLTLPLLAPLRRRFGAIDQRLERSDASLWFKSASIRPDAPERGFAEFSGGNQQKIVLSKWLRTSPGVLLLDEPTQGVDVGAKAAIHALIRDAAAGGAAVLVCSSDTEELVALSDRVAVLNEGRVAGVLSGADLTEPNLIRLTLSARPTAPATGGSAPTRQEQS